MIFVVFFFFSTNLQCSAKLDLNIFRLTVPIICIPLTHSEQRHLSRNTADKRETINPGKITGTESLSCILPEMRQRSYYVHPSGLASESKQYSSVDMVLFKGTLHWTEISAFRQSLLLLRCGSAAAFLKGSSAPQNYFVAQVLHVVDETMQPLPKGCLKSKADSMRLLKNGDSSVARWSYTHFTGFSFMLTPHPDVSCECQFAFNEPNEDRAFQIQVLQLWKGMGGGYWAGLPFSEHNHPGCLGMQDFRTWQALISFCCTCGKLQLLFHLLIVCLFPSLSISAILIFSYKIWGTENLGTIPFFSDITWKRHLSHSSCSGSTAGGHSPCPARPFPYHATDKTYCSQLGVLAEAAWRIR